MLASEAQVIGLRKFIVVLLVIAIATGLSIAGILTGDNWVETAKWITGLYMVGNVASKAAECLDVKVKSKEEIKLGGEAK